MSAGPTDLRDLRLTPAESAAVAEFVSAVRRLLADDLHELRLFGSRARGEGHEESDVDVAVVVTPNGRARRHDVYDVAFDIGLQHGVQLAPMVITQARLKELRAQERRLAADLDREGIRL